MRTALAPTVLRHGLEALGQLLRGPAEPSCVDHALEGSIGVVSQLKAHGLVRSVMAWDFVVRSPYLCSCSAAHDVATHFPGAAEQGTCSAELLPQCLAVAEGWRHAARTVHRNSIHSLGPSCAAKQPATVTDLERQQPQLRV